MSRIIRRIPLAVYMAFAFVGLSVWARDVRGVYVALALLAVVTTQRLVTRHAERAPEVESFTREVRAPRRSWDGIEAVLSSGVALLLILGVLGGGMAGWLAAGNLIATAGAAVMGGVVALLLAGLLAAFAAVASALVQRR